MPAAIRTQTLTRDHFDAIQQRTLENLPTEGVLHEETGDRDVAISVLLDPQGIFPVAYQLISEPRNPITPLEKLSLVAPDGKKLPPAPPADKSKRVPVNAPGAAA